MVLGGKRKRRTGHSGPLVQQMRGLAGRLVAYSGERFRSDGEAWAYIVKLIEQENVRKGEDVCALAARVQAEMAAAGNSIEVEPSEIPF